MTDTDAIDAGVARAYWRALLDNATGLLEDAARLLEPSPWRARSLIVLAREEAAKANWIYDFASDAWTAGAETVDVPADFVKAAKTHRAKLMDSHYQGSLVAPFWGDYSAYEGSGVPDSAEEMLEALTAAYQAIGDRATNSNVEKQAGLYVDLDLETGTVTSPSQYEAGDVVGELVDVAGIVEMYLITDHSRMKFGNCPYDSTHDVQCRLLPLAHPEDFSDGTDD